MSKSILHQPSTESTRVTKSWSSPTRLSKYPHTVPCTPSETWISADVTHVTRTLLFDITVELNRLDSRGESGKAHPRAFYTWLTKRGIKDAYKLLEHFGAVLNLLLARMDQDTSKLGLIVEPLFSTHLDAKYADDAFKILMSRLVWLHTPRAVIRFLERLLAKLVAIKNPRKSLASKKKPVAPTPVPKPAEKPKLRLVR